MVTADQPPVEAEGSSGSGYAHAAEVRRSIKHRMLAVRYGVDFFLMHMDRCTIFLNVYMYIMQNHTVVSRVPVAPHLVAVTP